MVEREHIRHRLHVGAGEIPWKSVAGRADAELALGQVDGLEPGLEREAERTEAVSGIDAVAIEFARAAGGDDERVAEKDGEAQRIFLGPVLRAHGQEAG